MVALFKGLIGRWESARKRGRVVGHFDRFHEGVEGEGEHRLAEVHQLVFELWDAGLVDRVLGVLREEQMRLKENEWGKVS